LVQETKAREARNIEITNLGLFPWEGIADGLQHETGLIEQARKKDKYRRAKVADYVLARDEQNRRSRNPDNEPVWQEWLQDNRIELNAMTSPQVPASSTTASHCSSTSTPRRASRIRAWSSTTRNFIPAFFRVNQVWCGSQRHRGRREIQSRNIPSPRIDFKASGIKPSGTTC